ncbi:stigma-specific Stig1 family protein [Actinidia rufa]|uniref:Stigma-specific Stig1 family protein n=1 Tax=Actinidia rufa TaxID=165716 RepID=A0A7J0EZ59_9ERIC|nr:stigma-specific Stig1 family protein [Actinidia rufa]
MELLKLCFILLVVMGITVSKIAAEEDNIVSDFHFLRGTSRFLAQSPRATMTCDKYPRVCVAKGSPGPDCCYKQCVNVMSDKLNCGKCGYKCKYSETCCQGKCVNPSVDERNCGRCNNRCKNGGSCAYGLCSYG